MVKVEKEHYKIYYPEKWEELKQKLRDSICEYDFSTKTWKPKRCSVNCAWLYECDGCEEPFCFLNFKTVVDEKKVYLCHETYDQLCEDCHIGCNCYEREDKRQTCPKCGFKTDSPAIMKRHHCVPKVEVT